jgi:predicted transposase YbfD/YdcC
MDKKNPLIFCFSTLEDPRKPTHSSRHNIMDILLITILASICGADSWVAIEKFAHAKEDWLTTILELPHGIPSHDTFGDFFSRVDPKQLQDCFLKWINQLFQISGGEIIAIDGKTLRHSYDTSSNRGAIHMVSAWACKNNLVLGQYKTNEKSNEITAIPELLKVLDLKGNIVTIDAMGCQKDIAEQIIKQGGDYVFNLKGNQGNLHKDVQLYIESAISGDFKGAQLKEDKSIDAGHGRIESRHYWVTQNTDWLEQHSEWAGLKSIGMVEYKSECKRTGKIEIERRFFISSLAADAKKFSEAVRLHWRIENSLHWCLDVAFNEDACRIRKDNAPENLAVIRHIALNLLKQEKTAKVGIHTKRLMAGWDHKYLAKVLGAGN